MNKYVTMLKTEIKLSFRGMDMVIFALCLPVVVVVLLGIIYGNQPAFEGASYSFLEQSFGAISTISILSLIHISFSNPPCYCRIFLFSK